jgi:hypothetical protein
VVSRLQFLVSGAPAKTHPEMSNESRKPNIHEEWVLREEQSDMKQNRVCNHLAAQAAKSARSP